MQAFNLRVLVPFFHFAALVLAIPIFDNSLLPFSHHPRRSKPTCANSPATIAGTTFTDPTAKNPLHPRSPPLPSTHSRSFLLTPTLPLPPSRALSPRRASTTFTWCAPNTHTYITLTPLRTLSAPIVIGLLSEAYSVTQNYIHEYGDEVIWGGTFDWTTNGLQLHSTNANNHQVTFGVLGAALWAVGDFMGRFGWGAARFGIWDGGVYVGVGRVG